MMSNDPGADGYPMEQELSNTIEKFKNQIAQWPYSKSTILIHPGEARPGPQAGEIFHQPELAATLRKLVEAEGVLLMFAPVGFGGATVKISPPLTIPEDAILESAGVLEMAFEEAGATA